MKEKIVKYKIHKDGVVITFEIEGKQKRLNFRRSVKKEEVIANLQSQVDTEYAKSLITDEDIINKLEPIIGIERSHKIKQA